MPNRDLQRERRDFFPFFRFDDFPEPASFVVVDFLFDLVTVSDGFVAAGLVAADSAAADLGATRRG